MTPWNETLSAVSDSSLLNAQSWNKIKSSTIKLSLGHQIRLKYMRVLKDDNKKLSYGFMPSMTVFCWQMLQVFFSIWSHLITRNVRLLTFQCYPRREMFCSIQMNTIMQTIISLTDYILNVYLFIVYLYLALVRSNVYSPHTLFPVGLWHRTSQTSFHAFSFLSFVPFLSCSSNRSRLSFHSHHSWRATLPVKPFATSLSFWSHHTFLSLSSSLSFRSFPSRWALRPWHSWNSWHAIWSWNTWKPTSFYEFLQITNELKSLRLETWNQCYSKRTHAKEKNVQLIFPRMVQASPIKRVLTWNVARWILSYL